MGDKPVKRAEFHGLTAAVKALLDQMAALIFGLNMFWSL